MSEPFISQIEIFAFNFPPRNWALCNGALLSIAQNQALFSLLGTTYGGNGQTTFALPDLRGRVPVGMGQGPGLPNITQGEVAGEERHTLITTEMPAHTHFLNADANTTTGLVAVPTATTTLGRGAGTSPAGAFAVNMYGSPAATTLNSNALGNSGASASHENRMPYLTLNFCICLFGVFPSRN